MSVAEGDPSRSQERPAIVRLQWHGNVAEVVLDNPPVNALTQELLDQLRRSIAELSANARAVVVRSALPRVFVAGGDLNLIADGTSSEHEQYVRDLQMTFEALADLGAPVVTVVDGHCIGGGLELALAGDVIVASTHARFALPEARLGVIPAAGGVHRLVRRVGEGHARYVLLTACGVDASRAFQMGLIDELHGHEEVVARALTLAAAMAGFPPSAMTEIKRLINRALDVNLESGLAEELLSWMAVRPEPESEAAIRAQVGLLRRSRTAMGRE
jgi:enoyl-CoA hydratase/carnithine racemase